MKLARTALLLLLVATPGLIASQGWRTRLPAYLEYLDGAHALISAGTLPDHGHITSYESYSPPGAAWLVAPGMWLFSDPRLVEVPANVLLHLGTLLGIFVLARSCVGVRAAALSVLLYAVSEPALQALPIGNPPQGHQFFYVWTACWTSRWVARQDPRYLAATLITWSAGMYVHMEIAPAACIPLTAWVVYRPPVRARPLAIAGAIALLMWLPYLRFEAPRHGIDLRSQLLLEPIDPVPLDTPAGCRAIVRRVDASAPVMPANPDARSRAGRVALASGRRLLAMTRGLTSNFRTLVPGGSLWLFALTLAGLLAIVASARSEIPVGRMTKASGGWVAAWAIGLLIGGALANEAAISRALSSTVRPRGLTPDTIHTIRLLQAIAVLGGVGLLTRRRLARPIRALASRLQPAAAHPGLIAIALVVPWSILLLVVEHDRMDRFEGLWPLQVIVLACVVEVASRGWSGVDGWKPRVVPLLAIGVLFANPFVKAQVEAWRIEGWAGTDAAEVLVAEDLARRIREGHSDRPVIGYRFSGSPESDQIDTDGVVAHGFDLLLKYRHGIARRSPCQQGLGVDDEYRIVESSRPEAETPLQLDGPTAGRARLLTRIGNYELFKIDRAP